MYIEKMKTRLSINSENSEIFSIIGVLLSYIIKREINLFDIRLQISIWIRKQLLTRGLYMNINL